MSNIVRKKTRQILRRTQSQNMAFEQTNILDMIAQSSIQTPQKAAVMFAKLVSYKENVYFFS